jgi:hypothetical protein
MTKKPNRYLTFGAVRFGHCNFEFGIYPSTLLRVVSPSTSLRTVSLSNGLSNHLEFGACVLEFIL